MGCLIILKRRFLFHILFYIKLQIRQQLLNTFFFRAHFIWNFLFLAGLKLLKVDIFVIGSARLWDRGLKFKRKDMLIIFSSSCKKFIKLDELIRKDTLVCWKFFNSFIILNCLFLKFFLNAIKSIELIFGPWKKKISSVLKKRQSRVDPLIDKAHLLLYNLFSHYRFKNFCTPHFEN